MYAPQILYICYNHVGLFSISCAAIHPVGLTAQYMFVLYPYHKIKTKK
jgi:hypothetical protein